MGLMGPGAQATKGSTVEADKAGRAGRAERAGCPKDGLAKPMRFTCKKYKFVKP